jgi:CheY-like chemotaxis protein
VPKILIIDDDKTMVYLLTTLWEMDGFEVVGVKDWNAILKTVSIEKPDIIFMDYFLPNTDGLDILSKIRAEPDLAGTPVVMSSGMDVSDKCLAGGANAFLLKPFEPEKLIETLNMNIGEDVE